MHDGCSRFVEAVSARLDGEDPGVGDDLLDAHLAGCADCRGFAAGAVALQRRIRVRPAIPVPDRTDLIVGAAGAGNRRRFQPRRSGLLTAICLVVVGVLTGAGLAQIRVASPSADPYPGATVLPAGLRAARPDAVLTDTAGHPFDIASDTTGTVSLLYFGYTHCPNVCPINMALAAAAIHLLPPPDRHRVSVVFVTTDPVHDTAAVLRSWLAAFTNGYPGDPRFTGLTGAPSAIQAAEKQVDMPLSYVEASTAGGYQVVHAGYMLVYGPEGPARLSVDDSETVPELATTLRHLITAGSAR